MNILKSSYRAITVAAIAAAALSIPATGFAISPLTDGLVKSEKSFGVRGGYNTRIESPVAGLDFTYSFSRSFRLGANIEYMFRHNGTDAFAINVNAHYTALRAGKFTIYPLAGLSYTSWQLKSDKVNGSDSSTRCDYIGVNVGAGADYHITSTLKLNLEGKYDVMKRYSTGVFTLGIAYCF
ncbi:MAG: porin family protein [Bacteroides sp.]|nr:porin family protein [Bacteroides sp.]